MLIDYETFLILNEIPSSRWNWFRPDGAPHLRHFFGDNGMCVCGHTRQKRAFESGFGVDCVRTKVSPKPKKGEHEYSLISHCTSCF